MAKAKTKKSHSESGARHWWLQRASAVALIPLTVWFVPTFLDHIDDSYHAVRAWISHPAVAAALLAYLAAAFFHAHLGMQVIIEDYVSAPSAQRNTQRVVSALLAIVAVVSIASVLCIAI